MTTPEWHKTACVLCSANCGLEVRLEGRRITRVRGNKAHVASAGYTCEKGLRIDHYQNNRSRLTRPLRRRPDGTYEEIDWDTAIAEVAAGLRR
ncbi:MAG: molybdopterin oxidoreductase family protein, partial [Actinomyces sp.]